MQFKRQLDRICKQVACHPKMMALRDAVLEHFGLADLAAESSGSLEGRAIVPGRIIIFSSYRDSVTEILAMLGKYAPAIEARYAVCFVGIHS